MKRQLLALSSLFILFALMSFRHEFYVSITELSVKNDTLQIAVKLFTDDLEHALEHDGHKVFLDHSTDMNKAFMHVKEYALEHFAVGNAAAAYPIQWIGHEYVEDVTWLYGQARIDPSSKLLFVKNTMLMEGHSDQHNMVHLTNGSSHQSQLCTTENPEVRFSL